MGSAPSPLLGVPIPDSLGNASGYGAQQTALVTALEQFSVARYPDSTTGNSADPTPVAGKMRWLTAAGTYGEHLQYYSGSTFGWLPAQPLAWYGERDSDDAVSAGSFGNLAVATISKGPPGVYIATGSSACRAGGATSDIATTKLRFGSSDIGNSIPVSVGTNQFFNVALTRKWTASAAITVSTDVALQGALNTGTLTGKAGCSVSVIWLGLGS